MTVHLAAGGVRAVLLDIEGTTTPIAFVHDVLFGYARKHVGRWLEDADPGALHAVIDRLRAEYDDDPAAQASVRWPRATGERTAAQDLEQADAGPAAAYACWLMDRDRKSPALKHLQGLVWERGYQDGVLRGQVFADVPAAIARWRAQGIAVAIYSSGSVLAQRRLFESTGAGDLSSSLSGFFDTAAGPKMSSDSYARIAAALGVQPREMLFVSDVAGELAAARQAGCQVVLSVREGNVAQPDAPAFPVVHSFDEIA